MHTQNIHYAESLRELGVVIQWVMDTIGHV